MSEKKPHIDLGQGMLPLAVVFAVLKLSGVIDWPWIWVLLPLWLPIAVICIAAISIFALLIVEKLIDKFTRSK